MLVTLVGQKYLQRVCGRLAGVLHGAVGEERAVLGQETQRSGERFYSP